MKKFQAVSYAFLLLCSTASAEKYVAVNRTFKAPPPKYNVCPKIDELVNNVSSTRADVYAPQNDAKNILRIRGATKEQNAELFAKNAYIVTGKDLDGKEKTFALILEGGFQDIANIPELKSPTQNRALFQDPYGCSYAIGADAKALNVANPKRAVYLYEVEKRADEPATATHTSTKPADATPETHGHTKPEGAETHAHSKPEGEAESKKEHKK